MESFQGKNTNIKISDRLQDGIEVIKNGGLVATKTDTIYGILADAFNPESVEKIYNIKERELDKPFIILIPDLDCLEKFNVSVNDKARKILSTKGITVILKVENPEKFEYLHRGTKKLAFRIPDDHEFLKFLKELNRPVVAPSCNPSGLEPAKNIEEAINYFSDKIDLYINRGEVINNIPSTIVETENGKVKIVRHGSKKLEVL
ncbi:MAG: L-threonylcarbamoyladenylate synthase [Hydrogenothermaceae bacterium]|nr:L-threonylcarbamoyladenylate synthase [Hydrogenothermaceae bacterium]